MVSFLSSLSTGHNAERMEQKVEDVNPSTAQNFGYFANSLLLECRRIRDSEWGKAVSNRCGKTVI
jgi:hypothetical protein